MALLMCGYQPYVYGANGFSLATRNLSDVHIRRYIDQQQYLTAPK